MDKRVAMSWISKRIVNPIGLRLAGRLPGIALLETRGRKSGLPHRNPVGNGLRGETFWIVAEHGRRADYVKNLIAEPRVRVKVRGTWLSGRAHVLDDDDPHARLRSLGRPVNDRMLRLVGTDLRTIRIDLDTEPPDHSK